MFEPKICLTETFSFPLYDTMYQMACQKLNGLFNRMRLYCYGIKHPWPFLPFRPLGLRCGNYLTYARHLPAQEWQWQR